MLSHPLLWLAVTGWLAAAGTWVGKEIQRGHDYKTAYAEGEKSGRAAASSSAVSSATEIVTVIRQAEEATPLVIESEAIKALCCASASCRDRARLCK